MVFRWGKSESTEVMEEKGAKAFKMIVRKISWLLFLLSLTWNKRASLPL